MMADSISLSSSSPERVTVSPSAPSPAASSNALASSSSILLRSIAVILQYQLFSTNPALKGVKLVASSINDASVLETFKKGNSDHYKRMKKKKHVGTILERTSSSSSSSSSTTGVFEFSPDATAKTKNLPVSTLDSIYYTVQSGDQCFPSVDLLRRFVRLCAKDQKFEIEGSEGPILVDAHSIQVFQYRLTDFTTHLAQLIKPEGVVKDTGIAPHDYVYDPTVKTPAEPHVVVCFDRTTNPQEPDEYILDLSMAQYGENGRGANGETFFLGNGKDYYTKMADICFIVDMELMSPSYKIYSGCTCDEIAEKAKNPKAMYTECHHLFEIRLDAAAERGMEIWNERAEKDWCAYCGKPEEEGGLVRCGRCESREVGWCSNQHRVFGMTHHELSCAAGPEDAVVVGETDGVDDVTYGVNCCVIV